MPERADEFRSPTIIVSVYELVWSQLQSCSRSLILNLITFNHRRQTRLMKSNQLDFICYHYLITFDHRVNSDPIISLISDSVIALKQTLLTFNLQSLYFELIRYQLQPGRPKTSDQFRSPTIIVSVYELVWSQLRSCSMWLILNLITFNHRRQTRLIKSDQLDLKCYHYLITFDHRVNLDAINSLISHAIIALEPNLITSNHQLFQFELVLFQLQSGMPERVDEIRSPTIIVSQYELVRSQLRSCSMSLILNLITFNPRQQTRLIKSKQLDLKCYRYLIAFDHRVSLDPINSLISGSIIVLQQKLIPSNQQML